MNTHGLSPGSNPTVRQRPGIKTSPLLFSQIPVLIIALRLPCVFIYSSLAVAGDKAFVQSTSEMVTNDDSEFWGWICGEQGVRKAWGATHFYNDAIVSHLMCTPRTLAHVQGEPAPLDSVGWKAGSSVEAPKAGARVLSSGPGPA